MTPAEKQFLLDQLHANRERVRSVVAGLSEAQWNFRETPERWSAAECLEHLAIVEQRVLGRVRQKLTEPPEPEKRELTAGKDELISAMIPARARRAVAPEPARPTGSAEPGELLPRFCDARESTIDFARSADGSLRDHVFAHMALGEIDCYQWLLFLSQHGERHARQIEEVRSCADFPAGAEGAGA
jgi:hypothetical protein